MTIAQYIDRRDKLTNTLFIIQSDGKCYFVENNRMYTREEFNRKYPLPISFVSHTGENSDKTKMFLHTD